MNLAIAATAGVVLAVLVSIAGISAAAPADPSRSNSDSVVGYADE